VRKCRGEGNPNQSGRRRRSRKAAGASLRLISNYASEMDAVEDRFTGASLFDCCGALYRHPPQRWAQPVGEATTKGVVLRLKGFLSGRTLIQPGVQLRPEILDRITPDDGADMAPMQGQQGGIFAAGQLVQDGG
jgi:hypothetical protein